MVKPNSRHLEPPAPPGQARLISAAKLLIADRGNNRLLCSNSSDRGRLEVPLRPRRRRDGSASYYPDDAFFIRHGTRDHLQPGRARTTIQELAYPSGKSSGLYGHPSNGDWPPDISHEPDDAYLLKDGRITVAGTRRNCRVLVINPNHTSRRSDRYGRCLPAQLRLSCSALRTETPADRRESARYPKSTAPGSMRSRPQRSRVWSVQLPIGYPSDPQQLGPDLLSARRLHDSGSDHRCSIGPARSSTDTTSRAARGCSTGLARGAASKWRVHGQRRLPRPHGRDRSSHPGTRLAVRQHRQIRNRSGNAEHPGRVRCPHEQQINPHPPDDRIIIQARRAP